MKINKVTVLSQTQKAEPQNSGPKATDKAASSTPSAESHLSHRTQDASQDIDAARVAEIKTAIQEGRLEIDSRKIADGLIANIRDMLDSDR